MDAITTLPPFAEAFQPTLGWGVIAWIEDTLWRPDGYRTCPRCREPKPFDAFGRDRNSPDGLTTACRACRRT